ncbi:MAG TPA: hypothetical protein VGK48_11955 [Terriglobia bacterium]
MGRHLSQLSKNGTAANVKPYCYDDRAALRETIASLNFHGTPFA